MLTGRAWKAGVEVYMHFPSIWKVLEAMKRQDGLGASSTGQRLPERSYGSWREPEAIPDWKAYLEHSIAFTSYLESWKGSEKEGWTRGILNGAASPRAIIR